MSEPELLTEKEAAQFLTVTEGLLTRLRLEGGGPPHVKIGRSVRYLKSSLEKWVKAQERRPR